MTIMEMLITCALVVLFFSLVFQVLVPVFGITRRSAVRSQLQQTALVTFNKLDYDLRRASRRGISLLAGAPTEVSALSVHRVAEGTFAGSLTWEDHLVVYCWLPTSRELIRKTCPPAPPGLTLSIGPTRPVTCLPADLRQIATTTNGSESRLAQNVASFSVSQAAAGVITASVDFEDSAGASHVRQSRTIYVRDP